jgi:hypothetical protein
MSVSGRINMIDSFSFFFFNKFGHKSNLSKYLLETSKLPCALWLTSSIPVFATGKNALSNSRKSMITYMLYFVWHNLKHYPTQTLTVQRTETEKVVLK